MDGVVDASFFSLEVGDYGVEAAIIAVTRGKESLWSASVTPTTKWGYESRKMSIRFSKWHTVVAVPGVSNSFPCIAGDAARKMERRFVGKSFTLTKLIKW